MSTLQTARVGHSIFSPHFCRTL